MTKKKIKYKKKCIVMFSGGLDSRLALKIMQEQGFEIVALFFKLPFGTGCCNEGCSFNFSQLHGIKLNVFDCTKGKLLQEYLDVIKKAEHGKGAGINPCIDCRIFMFKKAKEFADAQKIELIASGEVLGERPMSQMKKSMNLVEEKSGLKDRLLRPLSAKLLPETSAEKEGIVDRDKLYDIHGRRREKQIALAKKFKISYPTPAGGCLLCEKELKNRLSKLLKRGMNEDEINLVGIGRHFLIDKSWVVIGRNQSENKIIEHIGKKYNLIVPDYPAPSAVVFDNKSHKAPLTNSRPHSLLMKQRLFVKSLAHPKLLTKKQFDNKLDNVNNYVNELILAYSKKGSIKDRKDFDKWKL